MIILAATTDKLQLVTDAAVTVDVHASFADYSGSVVTPGKQNTAISTAATTDILAAPAGSTFRKLKFMSVRNKHASSSVGVTVVFDQNGTDFEIHKTSLKAGECLEYVEGIGFFVLQAAPNITNALPIVVKLGSDYTNNAAGPTASNVSGLNVTTGIGTFIFQYFLLYMTAATTTGLGLSVDHTGTVTSFVATMRFAGVTTTASAADAGQNVVAAAAGIHNSLSNRAKSQTAGMVTASVDALSSDMLVVVEGLCIVTVDGSLNLWAKPEVSASLLTIKTGSSLVLIKTG